jgi:predicted dithiol-disulfide oxidoreductase (DUF899 family)
MTNHTAGTRAEWLAARLELLEAEKDADAAQRRVGAAAAGAAVGPDREGIPVRDRRGERFAGGPLPRALALLVYHFMFGPEYTAGCPNCSAIADGFDGSLIHLANHLANHDVTLCALSRAPLARLQAHKRRMGWSFPWASSVDSDFNYDFQATHTEEEWQSGPVEYNFRTVDFRPGEESPVLAELASSVGTGLRDVQARRARDERLRTPGRRRLPHLLGVRKRDRRPLGHVAVARPRATRSQRDRLRLLVAPP